MLASQLLEMGEVILQGLREPIKLFARKPFLVIFTHKNYLVRLKIDPITTSKICYKEIKH